MNPNYLTGKINKVLGFAAFMVLLATTAQADTFWTAGTADWNNSGDWNAGLPNSGVNAIVNNGGTVLIQSGDPTLQTFDIRAGQGGGSNGNGGTWIQSGGTVVCNSWFRLGVDGGTSGTYIFTNGTVTVSGETHIGENGSGHFIMHGGTFTANNWFVFSRSGGNSDGFMDGGTINKNNNGNIQLGVGGVCNCGDSVLFTQVGGTINCASEYQIATDNNSVFCTNNIGGGSGPAVLKVDNWFAVGRFGGYGTLNLSNNAVVTKTGVNGGNLTIASGNSVGIINQYSGSTLTNTATQSWIAENGNGTWNMYGGLTTLGVVHLTQNGGANGTFNLFGGDLSASEVTDNGGSGSLFLMGGVLHVGASPANPWMHGVNGGIYITNGSTIDTAGNNAIVTANLADAGNGDGSLTKTGNGILTLSGSDSYPGNTTVSAGKLIEGTTSGVGSGVSVASTAGYGVQVNNGQNSFLTKSSLAYAGTGSLNFDLGSVGNPTTSAPLQVSGAVTLNGNVTVNIADALPQVASSIPLMTYTSRSGTGSFVIGTLPAGVSATLTDDTANNQVLLNISSTALIRWDGEVAGSVWDASVATNWTDYATGNPAHFTTGAAVFFDDLALGSTTANLNTTVNPGTLVVTNNNLPYTIQGSGGIVGATSLVKQGINSLTILTTNNYSGATVISGGQVNITNIANGGHISAIGSSSSSANNLVLDGGTLSYGGAAAGSTDRGYSLTGNYGANATAIASTVGSLDLQADLTISGQVAAATGSSFVKTGPGALTYVGSVTNQLSGGNDPGYQIISGTVIFDGSAGNQVNHNQNEFYIGDSTTSGASILMTNTTLVVDSWFSLSRGNGNSGFDCEGNMYNSTLTCANFSLGYANNRPNLCTMNFAMTNSTLTDAGAFFIAESPGSTGTVTISGNSLVTAGPANPMLMGLSSGASGSVTVANHSIVTNAAWLSCGANGTGSLTLKDFALFAEGSDFNFGDYGASGTSGTLTIQDNAQVVMIGINNGVYVGKTVGAIGTVYQSGNTLINARSAGSWQLAQSSGSTGTWYQNGGTNYAGGWVSIGRGGDTSSTGLMIITNGLFDQVGLANALLVGEQGSGTLVITNAGVVISEATNEGVAIGWNGGIGDLELGGGLLVANFVQGGTNGGSSTFNFNGGTLRAGANAQLNFMTNLTTVNVSKPSTIDTASSTVAINQSLNEGGSGALTKIGTGALLLNGVNAYGGNTVASAGSLGGSGSVVGNVTIASTATLAPSASAGINTFTIGGNLAINGNIAVAVNEASSPATNDFVTVAGTLTASGSGTVKVTNLGPALNIGDSFKLFSQPVSGGAALTVVPSAGVVWQNKLAVDGSIKVVSYIAPPVVTSGGVNVLPNGNVTLTATGTVGSTYTLRGSTSLLTPRASWQVVATGTVGTSPFSVTDTTASGSAQKFYIFSTP